MNTFIWRPRGIGIVPAANDEPVDLARRLQESAQYAAMKSMQRIIFFGDSRIEWADWSALLHRGDISNRGIARETLGDLVRRMRTSVPNGEVICIIQAGVNDVIKGASSEAVVAGYRELAQYLLKERRARVMVTSIIPVGEEQRPFNATIAQCNRMLSELAETAGMEWLDLNAVLAPHGYLLAEYSNDGVHLNAPGYAQVCGVLAPSLPPER